MNAKMADLRACFEKMGYTEIRTVLSSGNVVFSGPKQEERNVAKTIESGLETYLPRSFPVIVRTTDHLRALIATDPYAGHSLSAKAKRVVTFLSQAPGKGLSLPIGRDGASILAIMGSEVFTAYVPNTRGPVFMALIEKTFGKNVTTRTWATVTKCAAA